MSRQLWTETDNPSVIKRLNKTITIPAFSAECGQAQRSLFIAPSESFQIPYIRDTFWQPDLSGSFTIDMWARLKRPPNGTSGIFVLGHHNLNVNYLTWTINPSNDIATISGLSAPGPTFVTASFNVADLYYNWHRFTFVYDGAVALFYIYVDKELVQTADTLDEFLLNGNVNMAVIFGDESITSFNGHVAELKIFKEAKDLAWMNQYGDAPYFTSTTIDSSLSLYMRFLEIGTDGYTDATVSNSFDTDGGTLKLFCPRSAEAGADPVLQYIDTEEYPPLRYGASFIAAKFASPTLANNISIHPVTEPADVNFLLCVSWTDDDGVFQRKRLWRIPTGVDIAPIPERYNGEKLPSSGFNLECWNIDGNDTIDLEEDLVINFSPTTTPVDSTDTTQQEYTDPTEDSSIAEGFPLTPFPLQFTEQQTY